MYLKRLKKIFCSLLTAVIAFSCVGTNQAFCADDEKTGTEPSERVLVCTCRLLSDMARCYAGGCQDALRDGADPTRRIDWLQIASCCDKSGGVLDVKGPLTKLFWGVGGPFLPMNAIEILGAAPVEWSRFSFGEEMNFVYDNRYVLRSCAESMLNWCVTYNRTLIVRTSKVRTNYSWKPLWEVGGGRVCRDGNFWQLDLAELFLRYQKAYPNLFRIEDDDRKGIPDCFREHS